VFERQWAGGFQSMRGFQFRSERANHCGNPIRAGKAREALITSNTPRPLDGLTEKLVKAAEGDVEKPGKQPEQH
jgi:hypothetical protein